MALKSRARKAEGQNLDLTPMLDVVFILLIFFIVTAQFIKEPGVPIERTDVENDEIVQPLGLLIAIDEESEVWVDGNNIDIRELEFTIRELRRSNPQGRLVLQAHNDSEAEMLDLAMQAIMKADPDGKVEISTELD